MKKVYYTSVDEDRESAIAKATAVLVDTFPDRDGRGERVRILTVRDGTEEREGQLRHPDTHRQLPAGTRAYIVEAYVPGDVQGFRRADDGPLPPGVTPPGQGQPGGRV